MSTLLGPKTTNCLILALQSEYFPASLIRSDSYVNVFGLWPKRRHLEALPWAFIMIYTQFSDIVTNETMVNNYFF